jgi:hypothetical protein
MLFPRETWDASASLLRHVAHIVSVRAQKQMREFDARWVVTAMTHFCFGWNGPIGERPRIPMRVMVPPILASDLPVPGGCFRASPYQTVTAPSHFGPEQLRRDRTFMRGRVARVRAISLWIGRLLDRKHCSASITHAGVLRHSGYLIT